MRKSSKLNLKRSAVFWLAVVGIAFFTFLSLILPGVKQSSFYERLKKKKKEKFHHIHRSPKMLKAGLALLIMGAIFMGYGELTFYNAFLASNGSANMFEPLSNTLTNPYSSGTGLFLTVIGLIIGLTGEYIRVRAKGLANTLLSFLDWILFVLAVFVVLIAILAIPGILF